MKSAALAWLDNSRIVGNTETIHPFRLAADPTSCLGEQTGPLSHLPSALAQWDIRDKI
jgi:hypothetical protein